ncbi:MAG: protein kinase, partial [Chloroflexi bacterium]|nr:protein kinase [Chloroflexota bacterium]
MIPPIMASERVQRRIDRLLDQADEALEAADWQGARERAAVALEFDPDNAEAAAFLAAADKGLGISEPAAHDRAARQVRVESSEKTAAAAEGVPGSATPTSFADGRYQVSRFLGEGGKKRVYQAHDTLLDRDVAFALIKTDGLDDASRSRITREAQAMGRLGTHPNIVTVFDLGTEDNAPFMVTELMGGGDVEGLLEDAEDNRLSLEQTIEMGKAICEGLQFAHSQGVIHRDIKPGNVWLTTDGIAKIGDFGLAVMTDRSRLTREGMMVGTVSYMPPEQATGGEITPKADLYSLGAMLYEMVTGRPPFLGDDEIAIIGQHINTPPVAPTWHNGKCPRPLEALIMRLLSKDPSERPESAQDAFNALDAIDLTMRGETVEREATSLDSLAGGVFVGRQAEMGQLKAALEEVLGGSGRLVALVGEPGIGKTRTSEELATYASLRGAQVLWGRCYDGGGAPPYWPWVQAIRSYVREADPERLRIEMGAGAADIAEIVSDVSTALAGLQTPPELETPEQERFRLFDSITSFLKTASHARPLVIVLEDLHWADRPSLAFLEFITRELQGSRILLIGTYRDMEVNRRHPLAVTLGELTRERLFERVVLRGLQRADVERFIEVAAGLAPPAALVDAVFTQTEGNPLFVTEVVRLLVQEGLLTSESTAGRDTWSVPIPEGIRDVIGRRLDRLSERCNETLSVGAVIGREFGLDALDMLIEDASRERLADVLEEALAARVIEELPTTVGRYQFAHALIQETLLEELSLNRRVRLHAAVADALEKLYGEEADAHATELLRHVLQAESLVGPERVVHYSLVAGENALAGHAFDEAEQIFSRALAIKEPSTGAESEQVETRPADADTAAILFGLGRAQAATLPLHRLREAVASLGRAFDFYSESGDVELAVAVAEHPFPPTTGHLTGAPQLIARALELVPPDSLQAGRLLSIYGRVLSQELGDSDGSREAFDRALAIAEREGDAALEMRTLVAAGDVDLYDINWEGCLDKGLRAIELVPRVDDPRAEMLAYFHVSVGHLFLGDPDLADEPMAASVAAAERNRDHFYLARALFVGAILARCRGDWEVARGFSGRALEASPREPRNLYARILEEYEVGNFKEGEALLERLLEVQRLTEPGPTLELAEIALATASIAVITGQASRFDAAETAAETVLSAPSVAPLLATIVRHSQALLAIHRKDAAAAGELYAGWKRTGLGAFTGYGDSRLLGLLAHTLGRFAAAATHFEDEMAFCRRVGFRPQLAWACSDYAEMLLGRDEPGDREKAIE